MSNDVFASLALLSDAELVTRTKSLLARERRATAHLVAHLAELDTRDVHLREGYTSLFAYCVDALGLSEGETANRIEVARAARRFPVVLGMLLDGAVTLTAVRLLAPHLTEANHCEVLASARGRRKSEIAEIVARLAPRPDAHPSLRRLSLPQPEIPPPAAQTLSPKPDSPPRPIPDDRMAAAPLAPVHALPDRAAVTPLSPDRYRLQLTIGGETLAKLRLAKDMLSHAIPDGDHAAVLDRALAALLVELARKKFAETSTPRPARAATPDTPHIPAAVKRAVWIRDLGRCAFVGPTGRRCNASRFVEFHHVDPQALGGEASVDRIALRCRAHNDYEGRLWFGPRRHGDGSAEVGERAGTYGIAERSTGNMFRNM